MKSYSKALKILKQSKIILNDEKIKSSNCLNRVSSVNVYSKTNYPSANNSAFDGYAINFKDTKKLYSKKGKFFRVLGTIAAGDNIKHKKIQKFDSFEIMTGGVLPKDLNAVIPKENVVITLDKKKNKKIFINQKITKNKNIRLKGSDFKKKDLVIKKGTILKSNHILALKTLGINYIKVKKIPNILFFSTGNELSNQKKIPNWKIRNSNTHYLKSINHNFLFNFYYGGNLRDHDEKLLKKEIKKFLKSKIDLIITSGAVSAGKFDYVPKIIKQFKLSSYFKNIAIRPGKPILFAKIQGSKKAIFGLPGNPISSVACFRFFVYPYLLECLGVKTEKPIRAILKNNFTKHKNFTRFVRSKVNTTKNGKLEVKILSGQESFRIHSFVESNIWTVLPSGKSLFKKNEIVDCFLANHPNKIFS